MLIGGPAITLVKVAVLLQSLFQVVGEFTSAPIRDAIGCRVTYTEEIYEREWSSLCEFNPNAPVAREFIQLGSTD